MLFVSLLASAGGAVLEEEGGNVSLEEGPTRKALAIMKRLGTSRAADPALATAREDQARLAFEAGRAAFMVNYTYVWPSARSNAPAVAERMGWSLWPGMEQRPSRVAIGGLNLGVSAYSRHPELAFRAALCLASEANQRIAAERGGLPPTIESLYDAPEVRRVFPFAGVLRETLKHAVQRPQTPFYNDVSLAIGRILHPLSQIEPERDVARLRAAVGRALRSGGVL